MNYNSFNVPTLSLSGSRSRKQFCSIPTKDNPQTNLNVNPNKTDYIRQTQQTAYHPNQSLPFQEKNKRSSIFPPKASNSIFGQVFPPAFTDNSVKDINKNVYLQKIEQESPQTNQISTEAPLGTTLGVSNGRLLTNPLSSRVVEEEINQRTLNRKAEISKVLFEKKMSKLFQQAKFYDEQLSTVGQDEVTSHLNELQNLKEESLSQHRSLLNGLNALLA